MEGPWIKMPKTPETTDREKMRERPEYADFAEIDRLAITTVMHDDAAAQAMGFQGGFVGGPSVEGVMAPAIFASFGHTWYESGAHSFRIFKPVYADEEVRVVWEESEPDPGDKRKITYWAERKDSERVAAGWAAIGTPGEDFTPPWQRGPARVTESADDLLPNSQLGETLPPHEYLLSKNTAAARSANLEDWNWWYRIASPWGDTILPPSQFGQLVIRHLVTAEGEKPEELRIPPYGMYGGVDLVVYQPVFTDHIYRIDGRLCEKGRTAQSVYTIYEFNIDDDSGKRVALVRYTMRFLLSALMGESKV